ncbi:MAG: hypothetical protein ABFD92_10675 [Planctomycetaceae bacterium]|nr:hypothetical protein [Planctomycetaceae bacterium]
MTSKDVTILRELARQYAAVCADPVQDERRRLWADHNSLIRTRPLIYVRAIVEVPQVDTLLCQDPFYRGYEHYLRHRLYWASLGDDWPHEPWITVQAVHKCWGWGLSGQRHVSGEAGGSWKVDYPIKALRDVEKLQPPRHEIDEAATAAAATRLREAIGDILTINIDRGPAFRMWSADISTDLGYLRGIENVMLDMMDNPRWLHELCAFMRDGILRTHEQAEAAGDWGLCDHENQAVPYACELPAPAANVNGVRRGDLWGYMAAQEMTLISPAMHEEFILQYQLPIMKAFGLTAYGCCENLTHKIDMLRQVPNLRRIAVAPVADVKRCAEQIGTDYVISYRPNPAQMVCVGFEPDKVRKIIREAMEICRGLHVDITLKDVQTVEHQPERYPQWVKLVREIADEFA